MSASPGTTTGFVEHDGVRLAYVEAGQGSPAVLLVHGMACDHTHLLPQLHHLERRHRVVAVDLRGHGASDAPEGDYSGEVLGEDLRVVCRELGLDRPVVVGHSLGGSVSLALAGRRPDLFRAVVLLDSGIRRPDAKRQELQPFYDTLGGPDHADRVRRFVADRLFLPTDGDELVDRVAATMAATAPHVFLAMARGVVAFDSQAAAVACPVPGLLILSGQPFIDPVAVADLPDQWQVARVAGAGHFIQLVVPDQVNAMLDRFLALLAGHDGRPAGGPAPRRLSARAEGAPPIPRTAPARFEFGQGLPDPALFPVSELRRCLQDELAAGGADACSYFGAAGGVSEMRYGSLALRRELADHVSGRDGAGPGPEGIVLAQGSIDALALAVAALVGPGDGAVVEETTFPYVPRFLVEAGATVRTVPVDADGMVVDTLEDRLESLAAEGRPPRVIYTIPSFHSPTGTLLPLARRQRLLQVARQWGVTVIEDNCYHEFWYGSPPPPTLLALDGGGGTVLQADTFSKLVAPGLRIGWLAGDPPLLEAVARSRQDFSVSQILARGVARFLDDGLLAPHLDEVRGAYRRKRDATVAALGRHCAGSVTFAVPSGGFYLWLRLADGGVDAARAVALADEFGVSLRPGTAFGQTPEATRHLRLAMVQVAEESIDPGVALLGEALQASRG